MYLRLLGWEMHGLTDRVGELYDKQQVYLSEEIYEQYNHYKNPINDPSTIRVGVGC